jgi:hypothetical protein
MEEDLWSNGVCGRDYFYKRINVSSCM